eukprot:CAMPEP_0119553344 /NCGR_PEP_ID=MMETSP1352-20130426/6116_1 /TAXON_ID=265584 /ORGANISM="Stauroneis constricta, Strain CCMP1120" /LENGTH=261 /DNA_ID=CAMNT_0007599735 /DNA_START=65 /DNA_END=850 /DNA_ORIENTATION=+
MIRKIFSVTGISLLLVAPAAAQFGVGGGRGASKGATFQELNEQAKQMQQGGGAAAGGVATEDVWANAMKAFDDPAMAKQMEEAMKMMENMTPEQLQKQMEDAMKMLTDGDLMQQMMSNMNKDELFQYLEQTGSVPPAELAKMKTDPEYFELKMKESMEQMGSLLQNPDVLKGASQMMEGMKEMMNDPSALNDMMKAMTQEMSDEQIEEARLKILADPGGMGAMFEAEEMQDILKDPKKWRESVKEGQGMMTGQDGSIAGEL